MKVYIFLIFSLLPLSVFCQEYRFEFLEGTEDGFGNEILFYIEGSTLFPSEGPQPCQNPKFFSRLKQLRLDTLNDSLIININFDPFGICYEQHSVQQIVIYNDEQSNILLAGYGYNSWDQDYSFIHIIEKDLTFYSPNSLRFFNSNDSSLYIASSGEYYGINPAFSESNLTNNWLNTDSASTNLNKYNFNLIGISPFQDQTVFGYNSNSIFKSDDNGLNKRIVDSRESGNLYYPMIYDSDSSHVYLPIRNISRSSDPNNNLVTRLIISDDFGETWSTSTTGIVGTIGYKPSPNKAGIIYAYSNLSAQNKIFISTDFGQNFTEWLLFNENVIGIYISKSTDYLYVLTESELFKVHQDSREIISLTNLIVNSENEKDTPSINTLHQNYPNPFNPSTVISYQLSENSMVSLKVFDALGREVAALVDELKSAGSHQITFDAAGLASGVYYYVLNADEQTLTKKLTLIK